MDQGQSFVISDVRFNEQIGYHFFSSENERKCYKIYNKVKKSSDNSDILNVGCIHNKIRTGLICDAFTTREMLPSVYIPRSVPCSMLPTVYIPQYPVQCTVHVVV